MIINIGLALIAAIQMYPLVWMFLLSLKNNSEIYSGNSMGLPRELHFENYVSAMGTGNVLRYMYNSFLVTAAAVAVSTLFAAMTAYAIARMQWKGGKYVLMLFLMGIMVPSQAVILPIYLIMHKTGLYNTRFGLTIVYIVFALPVAIFIISGFMKSLPFELEEAATLDGAGIYRIFFKIIFPLVQSALATVTVFSFLSTWNEFMYSF